MRLKVYQRAGQLSLPHSGITKTEKIELKHKTDEQISPVNGLEPWDQSDRQKQTNVEVQSHMQEFTRIPWVQVGQGQVATNS